MPLPIAAGDMEGLFWLLVIIASIIAQIVKAGKKLPGSKPATPQQRRPVTPPRPPQGYTAPQDELREFLESITRGIPEEEPVAPPVPVRATVRHVAENIRRAPQPRVAKKAAPAPTAAAERITPVKPKAKKPAVSLDAYSIGDQGNAGIRQRSYIRRQLKQIDSVRNAIVLTEILLPPVSIRKTGTPAPLSGQ